MCFVYALYIYIYIKCLILYIYIFKTTILEMHRTSLTVQWLKFHTSSAGDTGSITVMKPVIPNQSTDP